MVGEESDENIDMKTKEIEKQIGKRKKLVAKRMKTKTNKEAVKTMMKRYFENSF